MQTTQVNEIGNSSAKTQEFTAGLTPYHDEYQIRTFCQAVCCLQLDLSHVAESCTCSPFTWKPGQESVNRTVCKRWAVSKRIASASQWSWLKQQSLKYIILHLETYSNIKKKIKSLIHKYSRTCQPVRKGHWSEKLLKLHQLFGMTEIKF